LPELIGVRASDSEGGQVAWHLDGNTYAVVHLSSPRAPSPPRIVLRQGKPELEGEEIGSDDPRFAGLVSTANDLYDTTMRVATANPSLEVTKAPTPGTERPPEQAAEEASPTPAKEKEKKPPHRYNPASRGSPAEERTRNETQMHSVLGRMLRPRGKGDEGGEPEGTQD
jgi:hypothetical protein